MTNEEIKEKLGKDLRELQQNKGIIDIRCFIGERHIGGASGYYLVWYYNEYDNSYDFCLDGGFFKANTDEILIDTGHNNIWINY